MPPRSTRFQAIVAFVRKHYAAPGVTVTESKEFVDPATGTRREVDVVIEGTFDGDAVVTSIEVIEHARKADAPWVEGRIKKHERLPTTKLLLISRSGFTKGALAAVAAEGGWVDAITPYFDDAERDPRVRDLYFDVVTLSPERFGLVARKSTTDEQVRENVPGDVWVYDSEGRARGPIGRLGVELSNLTAIRDYCLKAAHQDPNGDSLNEFLLLSIVASCGYLLHHEASDEYHRLEALLVGGRFSFHQSKVEFSPGRLGDRQFHAANSKFLGVDLVWVATVDEERGQAELSWTTVNKEPLPLPEPANLSTLLFPEVLTVSASVEPLPLTPEENEPPSPGDTIGPDYK
ncbi:MAG: hypothetical protein M3P85_14015 [Actinomycetota bacterium]|nr:hypothetical protein [Actinomycetota bacterium]